VKRDRDSRAQRSAVREGAGDACDQTTCATACSSPPPSAGATRSVGHLH